MTEFVDVRHKESEATGRVPVRALSIWEGRGYERVSDEQVEKAEEVQAPTLFDPSKKSAKEVSDYLAGLDTDSTTGQAEYDRVVAVEKAGANRSTAIPTT